MKICVFCGSSHGSSPVFAEGARKMGQTLARAGVGLVYGGGKVGLMGALADAALAAGGEVVGVIPRSLVEREIAHDGLTELHVVDSMHARKLKMNELSDAFIAMPGGAGTLEELFEQWTWGQLGIHRKACGIFNIAGYFDPLLAMIDHMVSHAFLKGAYREMLLVDASPDDLLRKLRSYEPPGEKWRT